METKSASVVLASKSTLCKLHHKKELKHDRLEMNMVDDTMWHMMNLQSIWQLLEYSGGQKLSDT